MTVIGIVGQLNSGKDTVATYLAENLEFVHIALADPIKDFASEVFNFTQKQLWGPSNFRNDWDERYFIDSPQWTYARENLESCGPQFIYKICESSDPRLMWQLLCWFEDLKKNHPQLSPRVMLQTLGTEWGRECVNEDVWVNYMIRRSDQIVKKGFKGVIVSDVRFKNELDAIRKAQGKLIKVVRPVTANAATTIGVVNHPSESEQKSFTDDEFDYIVLNKGSLDDLYCELNKISKYL